MNRLSPLIVRKVGRFAPAPAYAVHRPRVNETQASGLLDDLKLFAGGWLGGLVFFGTFLS